MKNKCRFCKCKDGGKHGICRKCAEEIEIGGSK